jgi:hypothetical protein
MFALSVFMAGCAIAVAPALAESNPPQSTLIVINNFNEPSNAGDPTEADTDDVADTDKADADDQGDDNDDQGDDNDDQGSDDGDGEQADQGN